MLVDALHGLKRSDEEILSLFRQNAISHQIILSKVDRILFPRSPPSRARIERNYPELKRICEQLKGKIVTCCAEATLEGKKLGINGVRWAVLAATGLGEVKRKLLPTEISSDTPNDGLPVRNIIHPVSLLEC